MLHYPCIQSYAICRARTDMTFQDQAHINRVRDTLWQNSANGASVMVGSGFSRNAISINPLAGPMPTWSDLANRLHGNLYPDKGSSQNEETMRSAANALRTAQEHEAAFGRTALHHELQQLIADQEYRPGKEHQRLLQLPWRDVFTTNWDTLLERTEITAPLPPYKVVTSPDALPMAKRPRILKLHGSLPSQFPLIVTEEDYRTYPTKFAPFVNTAQQSMMETAFFLIGFSGDDPNFLSWAGWVRDNLGDSAPKIYLAGWLGLSPHYRRMLENRNIIPIDLAKHPKASQWPGDKRHQYATDWLLYSLELGQPYNAAHWPALKVPQQTPVPDILQPIEDAAHKQPVAEPAARNCPLVQEAISAWEHNRRIYPGWLAIPSSKRGYLNLQMDEWAHRLPIAVKDLSPLERLKAFHELIWRLEMLLVPIRSDLEAAIEATLNQVDCKGQTVNGKPAPELDWAEIKENWRNTAIALVTTARYALDGAKFSCRINALSNFADEDPELHHRINHERCLWSLCAMEYKELETLLRGWHTEDCDPVWMMRKSAILYEIGQINQADALLQEAQTGISRVPSNHSSLAGPSREGWILLSTMNVENFHQTFRRLAELSPLYCDAHEDRKSAIEGIGRKPADEAPVFDINLRVLPGTTFSNYNPYDVAYRATRLAEMTGLPPISKSDWVGFDVSATMLKKAAEELAEHYPEFAIRLVLRACTYDGDKTLGRVLSRNRVALLPEAAANKLAQSCIQVIEYARPYVTATGGQETNIFWTEKMRVAMEVLSRIILRTKPEQTDAVLGLALACYQDPQLARQHLLTGSTESLIRRAWESLPESEQQERAIELLASPIAGLDHLEPTLQDQYPEPGQLTTETMVSLIRSPSNEDKWKQAINRVVRGLRGSPIARQRASLRVTPLIYSGALSDQEAKEIADALWEEAYTNSDALPEGTFLNDGAFLNLCEPHAGLAEDRFRRKWLTASAARENTADYINGAVHQIGIALSLSKRYNDPLSLSTDEETLLSDLVREWTKTGTLPPLHDLPIIWEAMRWKASEPVRQAISYLPEIVSRLSLTKDDGEALFAKMKALTDQAIPAYELASSIAKIVPDRYNDAASALMVGLTSENPHMIDSAARGLQIWLSNSTDVEGNLCQPPEILIREIGFIIASRREKSLPVALSIAKQIFETGADAHKIHIRQLALDGLQYLAEELRYDREHSNPNALPQLRLLSAELAIAMAKAGLEDDPTIKHWIETAHNDPLPEVRHAAAQLATTSNP